MSFGSSSKSWILSSSFSSSSLAMVVLVIFVLQIWVCLCPDCKVEAARMLSENGVSAKLKNNTNMTANNNNNNNNKVLPKQGLFHKYFNGRVASSFNKTQKGAEESKRSVPSCPDPLHN